MEINSGSAVNQGLIGMQRSQQEIVRSAEQIAQVSAQGSSAQPAGQASSAPTMDVVQSLVNIQAQQQVFDSSAKVVSTADEMIGTLLDTKA